MATLAEEQAWRLPGNFARLPHCRVRPNEEQVDGAGCVVLEVPLEEGTETIWLDPGLGYSPRKWEVRVGNRLVWRRTNKDFREFAPGCWLPLEADRVFRTTRVHVPRATRPIGVHATHEFALCSCERCA